MKQKRIIAFEQTAICLLMLLLVVSFGGLAGQSIAANEEEEYPELYASVSPQPVTQGKVIYLTFDDGPSENTAQILDILKKHNAKATFFVTAQKADEEYMLSTLQRIVDEGHTIGLHSYSHRVDEIYCSLDSYLADISQLNDYLQQTVNVCASILRFPGGSATVNASPEVMKAIIQEMTRRGYPYYDWDVVSGDDTVGGRSAEDLVQRVIGGVEGRDSAIVLCHDSPTAVTTPQAVDQVIAELSGQGYLFCALHTGVPPVHTYTTRFSLDQD